MLVRRGWYRLGRMNGFGGCVQGNVEVNRSDSVGLPPDGAGEPGGIDRKEIKRFYINYTSRSKGFIESIKN
jgi:hypothetical protein